MWPTPYGKRVLTGPEWAVFRRGLRTAWRAAERGLTRGRPARFGATGFDDLTSASQIALLSTVGLALSDTHAPPPVGAEAEAAVFGVIEGRVQAELWREMAERTVRRGWRRAVARACRLQPSPDAAWPWPTCLDSAEWTWAVHALADRVLWDRDFEMAAGFLDADPATTGPRREVLGIPDDYFAIAPPDSGKEDLVAVRATLVRLTARSA